jgi:hypothetical protein
MSGWLSIGLSGTPAARDWHRIVPPAFEATPCHARPLEKGTDRSRTFQEEIFFYFLILFNLIY